MTLNTSQAEKAAANSIAYGQFLLILPLSCKAVINGTAPGDHESMVLVGAISEKLLSISTSGCTSRATAEGGE